MDRLIVILVPLAAAVAFAVAFLAGWTRARAPASSSYEEDFPGTAQGSGLRRFAGDILMGLAFRQ